MNRTAEQLAEDLSGYMERLFYEEYTDCSEEPRSNENHEYEGFIAEAVSHLSSLDLKVIIKLIVDKL